MAKNFLDYNGLSLFWEKAYTKLHGEITTGLSGKVDKITGMGLSEANFTSAEKTKLGNIADNAEVNQNAYSTVSAGGKTLSAGSKQDTLSFAAGDGVEITSDATTKTVTIKMSGNGAVDGGSIKDSTMSGTITNSGTISGGTVSGATISGGTMSGTITNSGTISGGTVSGATISSGKLSGTTTAQANSTIDLDGADSVTVPTATKGDNTTKAASTAFVKTAIDDAVSTINNTTSGLDTRLGTAEGNITTLQGQMTTLNGEGVGSVKKAVADGIASVVASAPSDFDTLKEIADYIATDKTGAATMQSDINDLKAVKGQVTSVANHYTPAKDDSAALNASTSTTTDITGSGKAVNVVTGLERDAKGHIVGVKSAKIYSTDNNTQYTGSNGITLSGTNFTNSGVRSVATGTANGTISVDTNGATNNVSVYGLKSAAYTESSAYAEKSHNHDSITGKAATAGTADKVANSFILKINGGTAEGKSLYTFDGSGAKSLNIKPGTNVSFTNNTNGEVTINSSNDNTTYTFAGGTNGFTVTPLGGTAQTVTVTPSITNNVTYTGTLVTNQVAVFNNTTGVVKASGFTIGKSVPADALFTDTVYTHPSHTSKTNGFYKVTVDALGHVSGTTAVAKSDITALGIPAQDTTYPTLTASDITTGTATNASVVTAKVIADTCATVAITEAEIDAIIAEIG